MPSQVYRTKIGHLYIKVSLGSPTTFFTVVLHTQFVHPHFDISRAAAIVAHTDHHGLHFAQRGVTDDAHFIVGVVAVVGIVKLCVTG